MRRKVYICSPLFGDIKQNLDNAKYYTKYALKCGMAPVTPHFYTLCFDADIKMNKDLIISAGLSLLWFCDEIWIFGEEVSDEMRSEISFCETMRMPIKRIGCKEIRKKLGEDMK